MTSPFTLPSLAVDNWVDLGDFTGFEVPVPDWCPSRLIGEALPVRLQFTLKRNTHPANLHQMSVPAIIFQ